jgi:hypothetical protein
MVYGIKYVTHSIQDFEKTESRSKMVLMDVMLRGMEFGSNSKSTE